MPSPDKATQQKRGIDWPGIIGILVVQLTVLLALSGAVIFYLDWSSNAAQAEFMATTKLSATAPHHPSQAPTPIRSVKGKTSCPRRV
jgi:hypothetical protein